MKDIERIEKFIAKHHVLTLASVSVDDKGIAEPYCANMFYAYIADAKAFVFTSDVATRHISDVLNNDKVAGSVVLETSVVGKIQGLQFQGRIFKDSENKMKSAYLKKYPFAAVATLQLWALELSFMKFTDNRLGFGKKLIWTRDE
ncbi:MAG: pyridoxamine 5'-phosphate oxidase family protein [Rikenellaceae bacterium]